MSARALAFALGLIFAGCVPKPTVVTESDVRLSPPAEDEPADSSPPEAIQLSHGTVVIDVRSPFEFGSSRIPRSISLRWSDFGQPLPAQRGVLQTDLFQIARRLAREGIAPDTPVVVVGNGIKGEGEEGRVAWMLRYLGVQSVRFAAISYFPGPFTSRNPFPAGPGFEAPPGEPSPKNAPIWKPAVDASWIATRDEAKAAQADRDGYALIDVRPARAFAADDRLKATNVPWTEFLDTHGRPDCASVRRSMKPLRARGKRLILFDDFGVASGGAAIALRGCGYPNAANYAGGVRDYFSTAP